MLALVFQIGADRVALDVRHVQEVVPRVRLQTIRVGSSWLAGVFIYHGQVVPVVDLQRLAGGGECPSHLSSRIILVTQPGSEEGRLLGLLASRVADLKEVDPAGQPLMRLNGEEGTDLGPVLADDGGVLHLLDLDRLLPESMRRSLLAIGREESP